MEKYLDYLEIHKTMQRVGDMAIDTVVQRALERKRRAAKPTPAGEAVAAVPQPKDQPITSDEPVSAVAGEIEMPTRKAPVVKELPSVVVEEGAPRAVGEETRRVEEHRTPVVAERGEPVAGEAPYTQEPQPEVLSDEEAGPAPEAGPEPAIDLPFGPELTPEERAQMTVRWQERERATARDALERAVRKLRELRALALEAQTTLRKYYDNGKVNDLIRTPEGAAEHQRAYSDLAWLNPEELVAIAAPSPEQRADILSAKGEIQIAQEKLDRARTDALDLGISEDEVARIIEPAAEHPAGLVDQPPTPQPGETAEQYLEKRELWKDALKSGVKAVPKIAWGVVSTLLGVRLAETGIRFFAERSRLKKEKKVFSGLVQELCAIVERRPTEAGASERAEVVHAFEQKAAELEQRIDALVRSGYLKPEDRSRLIEQLNIIVEQQAQQEQIAQDTLNKETSQIIHDYFTRKASGIELGKQSFNTVSLLAGVQTARALGYGAFTALGRAVRARKEYEQKIKLEGRPADFLERERAVLQNLVPQAAAEYAQGATGIWADLFTGRRVSRTEWAQKKMAFGKALSTTFIFAGMAKVAHAEMAETGYSVSEQIDRVLNVVEKHGLDTAIANNWLHNLEQLPGGKHLVRFFGREGNLEVAEHPEGLVKRTPPPEAQATPLKTEAELKAEAETNFFKANPAYQRLEALSGGKIDLVPHADGHVSIEVTLGKEGYAHIQQTLRDIAVLEKAHTGGAFGTLEATQVENAVANLKLLLDGKDLRFISADKLDGVAHVAAGKLVIDNAAKFHEFVQSEILKHAADKITAENLARHDEAVATVNNTSDANWQKDVNVGTGVEAPSATGYVKVSIDHELVHKAEIDMAQHEAAEFTQVSGIKVHVDPRDVDDEFNYTMRTAEFGHGQAIPVVDNKVSIVFSYVEGQPFEYHLPKMVNMDHPYAADTLKQVLGAAQEKALAEASAHAPPEGPEAAAAALPTTFSELVKIPANEGGLVSADGTVHLGEVKFPPELLAKIANKSTETFVDDPMKAAGIPVWRRFSDEAHAIRALANTIEKHFDPGPEKVGDQIIRYKDDFDRWMRRVPKKLSETTEIGGI